MGKRGTWERRILPLFQETTSKSVEAMIGSRVSGEFVNHSIASLAEGNDERLSGVRMMDGCSRWGMDEGTKDGNDALDFFFYFQRQKSRRRRWGWQREGGKFFEHWRLNWGFRDEFFKATTQQSHWQSIKKNKKKRGSRLAAARPKCYR